MPQVTVYIREQDLDKWKALEKKSEFIHNALNQGEGYSLQDFKAMSGISDVFKGKPVKTVQSDSPTLKSSVTTKLKLCKHGSPKGSCMHKEATRLRCNL